ncbi:MarR family winged helix-turn-helix transcriptional regulator [Saccharopolyspora flava]|uniref:DNA-binding transcriptional regulator, MarR family n=1 Tax=Saccharopolyspora flava TaxID=95161 RepID=A0A1I6S524_9PSEU|nr:MarR family transcriptional regulator [Saccharopolyspora flava]SFS72047.1 DNA-binding transcriptional regulator, MarR family [Saccharopolyspora flava]
MGAHHGLVDDLGFLLSRASGVVARSVSAELEPLGLRVRSYSVLALSAEEGAGINQRRLAEIIGLDPSQVVALVDELEQRDLVARIPDPRDRRNKLVQATESGRELVAEAQARVTELEDGYFHRMSPRRLDELRAILREISFPHEPHA